MSGRSLILTSRAGSMLPGSGVRNFRYSPSNTAIGLASIPPIEPLTGPAGITCLAGSSSYTALAVAPESAFGLDAIGTLASDVGLGFEPHPAATNVRYAT